MTSRTRTRWLGAGVIGLGVLAAAIWLFSQGWSGAPRRDPSMLHFRESAAAAGIKFRMGFLPNEQGETFKINLYDHGCGLAVGDYDGDGHDDIYFVNQLGDNALYRNKGDGTFTDVTAAAGVALGDRIGVAATFADYDNDGRQDLYVTSTRGGNVLFHNAGGGKFEDVTDKANLKHIGHSQTAVFFDYDNDGWLDLFLANTAKWTAEQFDAASKYWIGKGGDGLGQVVHSEKETNVLYRNNGNGTFTDVTKETGLEGRGWAGDAVVFDYNDDGKLDLLVTSMFGRSQLYRNNGAGKFTDVTLEVLGRTPWGGVGAKAFDFDSDGRLDLYIVDMHSDMWMGVDSGHKTLAQARQSAKLKFAGYSGPLLREKPTLMQEEIQLGREVGFRHEEVLFGNALYRNTGEGKFVELSDLAGLENFWPWGIATGDFDCDGNEDLFVPAGMGYPFYYWPNYLLMNQGTGAFTDRAVESGIEPPPGGEYQPTPIAGKPAARSSRCAVTADFDGDGRLEIVTNNFNDHPYYFKNQFPRKNWAAFRLRGTRSNRDAIGAVVRLHQGGKVRTRQVHPAGGYLSQSSRTVHFGLGDDPKIDRIEITWPSGQRQVLPGVALNQITDVVEPEGDRPAAPAKATP